jgi:uncharacterized membrane protein YfcA
VDLSTTDHVLAAAAAVAAGVVNAVAGGGTLITFPALVALGVPSVRSNITNTVALCPGYFGGTLAQRADLAGQKHRLRSLAVVAAAGGLVGSILLVLSPEDLFEGIIPFLLLVACALLGFQDRIRRMLPTRPDVEGVDTTPRPLLFGGVFVATVYGGYFGAGLGIMLIAVLGLFSSIPFVQLNAVKQPLAAAINLSAAAFLVFSGKVEWSLAAVMAPAALLGGALGGRLSTFLPARRFRIVVVTIGVVISIVYLVR